MKPTEWLEGAKAAHHSLLADLAGIDDGAARGASLLPHWSRGHVLTHLARNADSNTGIFLAAHRGEVIAQYPGGPAQRDGDIDAGAGRSAAALVADVSTAVAALEAAWDGTTDEVWQRGRGRSSWSQGEIGLDEWVFSRWRETEVHHNDLGIGFTWARWSAPYVDEDLRRATARYLEREGDLPEPALALVPAERLAWLMGRHWPDGLHEAPPWG
jgi:maleylpyruvate isomerase